MEVEEDVETNTLSSAHTPNDNEHSQCTVTTTPTTNEDKSDDPHSSMSPPLSVDRDTNDDTGAGDGDAVELPFIDVNSFADHAAGICKRNNSQVSESNRLKLAELA